MSVQGKGQNSPVNGWKQNVLKRKPDSRNDLWPLVFTPTIFSFHGLLHTAWKTVKRDLILQGPHLSCPVHSPLNIHFYLNIVSYITECKWSSLSFCHWTTQPAFSHRGRFFMVRSALWPVAPRARETEGFNNCQEETVQLNSNHIDWRYWRVDLKGILQPLWLYKSARFSLMFILFSHLHSVPHQ